MTKTLWRFLALAPGVLALSIGCPASSSKPQAAPTTPTPRPLSRANPNIVEEDDVHIVERFPKDQYIRVDDKHIRSPIIRVPIEFYKEDDNYYYVFTYKRNKEMAAIEAFANPTPTRTPSVEVPSIPNPKPVQPPAGGPAIARPTLADFEDLSPSRVSGRLHLEEVKDSGLPTGGQWRASFVIADMNGDGIPDIVAPAARVGNNLLHVWIGDGHGHFSPWSVATVGEDGKTKPGVTVGYGAVAVGDIDGDGKLDIVAAQHNGGLASFFGDGRGTFRAVRTGLPGGRDFSAQAIVLADLKGRGKLDIVAARDSIPTGTGKAETNQVRVFSWGGKTGWQYQADDLAGAFYSYSLFAWDFDRDGHPDILTGSHYMGSLTLLWKNRGDGTFEPVLFPEIEGYAFHFATAPGTFGKARLSAFADSYASLFVDEKVPRRAQGITLYAFDGSKWTRHRVWRKKEGRSLQYALAMGDLDGDGLDDIVFPDSETNRLRVFFQQPDGSFREAAESEEPVLDSPVQCVRLVDLDGDGRLDVVLGKTVVADRPQNPGGWSVYLNKR